MSTPNKQHKCLNCWGEGNIPHLSLPSPDEKGGVVILDPCDECNESGKVTKKVFQRQVKNGYATMTNLEILEMYEDT